MEYRQGLSDETSMSSPQVTAVDIPNVPGISPACTAPVDSIGGTATPIEVVWLFKHSAAATRGYVRKQAVVGLNGVQRVLVDAVARFSGEPMHVFDTPELAKVWLTGDEVDGGLALAEERPKATA